MADKFQSIFDDNVEAEKQFDTMFGSDEDDKLIEAVLSLREEGDALPDFEELHQTDDEAKPKDLADELGPNHDENKPTADSSDQEIIADDDDEILDLACPKFGVQDGGQNKKEPDNTDITDEIEKNEGELSESLKSLLDEADTDLGDNEGLGEPGDLGDADGVANDTSDTEELTNNDEKNEIKELENPVEESSLVDALLAEDNIDYDAMAPQNDDPNFRPEAAEEAKEENKDHVQESSLVDALLAEECNDPECSVDKEYTDPEDGQGEPDVDNKPKAGAEGTDKDPVYECGDKGCDVPSEDGEGDDSLVEALLAEADDDLPEEVEDELIADAEDDSEMADSEVDAIDDVYDDDLLDDVAGDED